MSDDTTDLSDRKLNWAPSRPDVRDKLFRDSVPRAFGPALLPEHVDISKFDSPIKDQGKIGCCTGESGNAADEHNDARDGKVTRGSELFVYFNGRRNKKKDTGAFLRDVVKGLAKFGNCAIERWPFDPAKFAVTPPPEAYASGLENRISDYARCLDLHDIKTALAAGYPVLIGFTCYDSLKYASKTGVVPYPKPEDREVGGHAVCLVGYDDKTRLLKFKNSWGTDWGDRGYGYLPYDYVPRLSDDYWVIRK